MLDCHQTNHQTHDILPLLGLLPVWANPPQHMWLLDVTSMHRSADFQIVHGVAARVVPMSSGWTSYGTNFTSSQHTWRFVEECCSLWLSWWSNAVALVGYTDMTLLWMMKQVKVWFLLRSTWHEWHQERCSFSNQSQFASSHALENNPRYVLVHLIHQRAECMLWKYFA